MILGPINHEESFFADVFLLKVHTSEAYYEDYETKLYEKC